MKISLDEIIKSINSQANNKSSRNDAITAKFSKQFSNEVAPVFLDIYESWKKLGIMGITFRTGIISVIYKKGAKNDIRNYKPIYYNYYE